MVKYVNLFELFMNIKLMIFEFFIKFICCILKKKFGEIKGMFKKGWNFLELLSICISRF